MYLKSLILKGFKSFADRTVISLEPGVTSIVGPNGSGKSNISDSVLWVLGERNAKNLRGQAMEDVIFSGSSARKPVGVAEVELVLDNTDGTLPVDFSEVSIMRRMYRSGESEYLINGSIVRRMDVLDILHDSGLGTGTNSIISQGNLDRVLSSKPEDRRALIEEAAGVLKHKQRKQKSERKLAKMDNHLDRVNDVTAEVERQLKPLERKAKRALIYQDLADELAELDLMIAVDELRTLRRRWETAKDDQNRLSEQAGEARKVIREAEAEIERLQEQLRARGADEGSLNDNSRRAQSLQDRLESTILLLHEKRRQAQDYTGQATLAQDENVRKLSVVRSSLETQMLQAQEASRQQEQTQRRVDVLSTEYDTKRARRIELETELDKLTAASSAAGRRAEAIRAEQERSRESMSENVANSKLLDAQIADLESRIELLASTATAARTGADELAQQLSEIREAEAAARSEVSVAFNEREAARAALDDARNVQVRASAETAALEELERAQESSNPALKWVLDNASELDEVIEPVSHGIKAPAQYEKIVEQLLGVDIQALLVKDASMAVTVADRLCDTVSSGSVALLPLSSMQPASYSSDFGTRLIDVLEFDDSIAPVVHSLLGDVFVCSDREEALRAHDGATDKIRCVTTDGFIVWPTGKIGLELADPDDQEGALARHRNLEQLRLREADAIAAYQAAATHNEEAEAILREKQTAGLKQSQLLAQTTGTHESSEADAQRAEREHALAVSELEELKQSRSEIEKLLSEARPGADELSDRLVEAEHIIADAKSRSEVISAELSPLRPEVQTLSESLSEARLELTRFTERAVYAKRMTDARKDEEASLVAAIEASDENLVRKRVAAKRIEPLIAVLTALSDSARNLARTLVEQANQAQSNAAGVNQAISDMTRKAREGHDRFDAINERLTSMRVEKGRLEMQVDAAVTTIVEDCHTSVETALEIPEVEDRADVDDRAFKLRRRITNMGTINPDAAKEYEDVKTRFDYLSAQLEDLKSARRSLAKIVTVIDERMKRDFIDTFELVNANFSEIFSTLFPGGNAHLSLEDPDHPETTGVEVNAQPVGKRVKKMSLLSGGEKSMTALALLFAVYRTRTTPFYILDEVEAALDDTNLRRLLAYLVQLRKQTQLLMITHQRRTMEMADVLYGVSMQADGVTKVLSQKLENKEQ